MGNMLLGLPDAAAIQQVVVEVLADLRRMRDRLDAVRAQLGLIADAAEHQQLGRVDAARAEDDLGLRLHLHCGAPSPRCSSTPVTRVPEKVSRSTCDFTSTVTSLRASTG